MPVKAQGALRYLQTQGILDQLKDPRVPQVPLAQRSALEQVFSHYYHVFTLPGGKGVCQCMTIDEGGEELIVKRPTIIIKSLFQKSGRIQPDKILNDEEGEEMVGAKVLQLMTRGGGF